MSNKWLFFPSSNIIVDGLILHLDAGNSSSYSGSGTTWTDLSGEGNNGTLVNGTSYTSDDGGSLVFDGTNDYVNLGAVQINTAAGTIGMWIKLDSTVGRFFGRGGNFESRFSSNRVSDATGTCSTISTKTGDMNIGRSSGMGGAGGLYVDGKIAAFHSYNRVLTLTEIQSNFNSTKTRFGI